MEPDIWDLIPVYLFLRTVYVKNDTVWLVWCRWDKAKDRTTTLKGKGFVAMTTILLVQKALDTHFLLPKVGPPRD